MPEAQPPITTLLFDLDGTLVDSVADLATAVNLLRTEQRLPPLGHDTVRSYVGDGATMLVKRALPAGDFRVERLHRFLQLYGEHLLEATAPYAGIVDFLEARKQMNLAVVTNKPEGLTRQLLDGLNLSRYFGAIVGGDTLDRKKPSPQPLQLALVQLGATAAEAAMIGDHHTDLHAGAAAGIRTCFCGWGFGHTGDASPTWRAATVADLERLFPEPA